VSNSERDAVQDAPIIVKLRAREVHMDAETAIHMLGRALERSDREWRVAWVASITLLRAIWHVVEKVDAKNEIVADRWRIMRPRLKANKDLEILRSFRDTILKEYDFPVEPLTFSTRSPGEEWQNSIYLAPRGELATKFHEVGGLEITDGLWRVWHVWCAALPYLEGNHSEPCI
jgi:hypothetical protein